MIKNVFCVFMTLFFAVNAMASDSSVHPSTSARDSRQQRASVPTSSTDLAEAKGKNARIRMPYAVRDSDSPDGYFESSDCGCDKSSDYTSEDTDSDDSSMAVHYEGENTIQSKPTTEKLQVDKKVVTFLEYDLKKAAMQQSIFHAMYSKCGCPIADAKEPNLLSLTTSPEAKEVSWFENYLEKHGSMTQKPLPEKVKGIVADLEKSMLELDKEVFNIPTMSELQPLTEGKWADFYVVAHQQWKEFLKAYMSDQANIDKRVKSKMAEMQVQIARCLLKGKFYHIISLKSTLNSHERQLIGNFYKQDNFTGSYRAVVCRVIQQYLFEIYKRIQANPSANIEYFEALMKSIMEFRGQVFDMLDKFLKKPQVA